MSAANRNRNQVAGISVILFCLGLFLTAFSSRNPWTTTIGAEAGSFLIRPFQTLQYGLGNGVSSMWSDYFALRGVREENVSLKERLHSLETQNSKLLELESENNRLRSLLNFANENALKGITGHVVGDDPSNWSRVVTLDIGASRGVARGLPIAEGKGVVGQVVAVGQLSSRVLLIVDHTSGVDAIVQGGRARGVVQGTGEGCEMLYVPVEDEVQIGDRVITSGMDGIFPKGLLIGVVSSIEKKTSGMFQSVIVKPAVDFTKLEEVFIIQKEELSKEITPLAKSKVKKEISK